MDKAVTDSLKSLANFITLAAKHGLRFSGKLSEKEIKRAVPPLAKGVNHIQKRLLENNISETPLVSPRPRLKYADYYTDEKTGVRVENAEYSEPIESYGCLGNGTFLPESWAKIFFEQGGVFAKYKVVGRKDRREPVPLSITQLIELWWKCPSDGSAGTGDEGFISDTGRRFYTPQTLGIMLEAMRVAKLSDGRIDPHDAYSHFVDLTEDFDPELYLMARQERECMKKGKPSPLNPY